MKLKRAKQPVIAGAYNLVLGATNSLIGTLP